MLNVLQRFRDDERGAEMIEWAVVTAVLLVATAGPLILLKGEVLDLFKAGFEGVARDPTDGFNP